MAPPQPKAAAKPAAAPAGGVKKAKVGKPRNYDLGNGVVRFSKTRMFHKTVSVVYIYLTYYYALFHKIRNFVDLSFSINSSKQTHMFYVKSILIIASPGFNIN